MTNNHALGSARTLQAGDVASAAPAHPPGARRSPLGGIPGGVLTVAIPVLVWLLPLQIEPNARHALAVGLFMILGWITEVLPHAITGLIGCYLFWILHIVRFDVAFAGFASETAWFYLGVLIFGMMASETGLSRRLAVRLLLRVGDSYSRIILGLILLSFVLTFLIPSGVACVVVMASIALGLLQAYGYGEGSNIARGIFITLTYTAGLFDKMVVAGVSSILGRGLIIKATNTEILWSTWLFAYLPLSLITIFATWRIVLWLYPPERQILTGGSEYLHRELARLGPWTAQQKRALVLMLCALALWVTDSLHHISPAVIGIGAGLAGMLPGIGVLQFETVKNKLNYMSMFFVASALSLGQVLMQTKALSVLTTIMFSWMAPLITHKYLMPLVAYWTAFGYHIFLGSELSMLATSVPPLIHFATLHHLDPIATGMVWCFAAGGKIFVYQSGVLIVGYSYGYFDMRDMLRVGGLLCIVESLLLLLLVPFYWPLVGI